MAVTVPEASLVTGFYSFATVYLFSHWSIFQDEQSGVCVEMMAMLTEMLWCSSQSSQLEIGSSLLNHFLQFSRRIIEQIDSDGKSSRSVIESK